MLCIKTRFVDVLRTARFLEAPDLCLQQGSHVGVAPILRAMSHHNSKEFINRLFSQNLCRCVAFSACRVANLRHKLISHNRQGTTGETRALQLAAGIEHVAPSTSGSC